MPLIPSARHTPADLAAWAAVNRHDRVRAAGGRWPAREAAAMDEIRTFGPDYVGVSWGKDSVVVAHLARRVDPAIPLVWVRIGVADNPDCGAVRDAFLAAHPGAYEEIAADVGGDVRDGHRAGFALASARFGPRYVSGVRAQESRTRRLRVARWGLSTAGTCAPIGRWTGDDVYAYMERHGLPVHPAYACTHGGLLDRDHIRVAGLGGERGTGMGRREWEWAYYAEEMAALGERDVS